MLTLSSDDRVGTFTTSPQAPSTASPNAGIPAEFEGSLAAMDRARTAPCVARRRGPRVADNWAWGNLGPTEIHTLLPSSSSSPQPDSVPFLLVRPVSSPPGAAEAPDDDAETNEIPSSRSVPPHAPPSALTTTETELPSVIVDLREMEASEEIERQRQTDVDGLLSTTDEIDLSPFQLPIDHDAPLRPNVKTKRSRRSSASRAFGFAIAAVAALTAAGGTFVGMRVMHVSPLHLAPAHLIR